MLTGIDHLVIAVIDPDAAAGELGAALGLIPGGGGRHDGLGTFNRLIWLGDTYLELIGVDDPDLARSSWIGAPAIRALERGGGLATWAIATDAIDVDVARLRASGSSLGEPVSGERARPDGATVRWRLASSPVLGPGMPPFLIEHDQAGAEWTPRDRAARADGPARLATVELTVDDVPATTRRFGQAVDLRFRPSLAGDGARDASIGPQTLRLRPRRDAQAPATTVRLSMANAEPRLVDLLDCRWVVQP